MFLKLAIINTVQNMQVSIGCIGNIPFPQTPSSPHWRQLLYQFFMSTSLSAFPYKLLYISLGTLIFFFVIDIIIQIILYLHIEVWWYSIRMNHQLLFHQLSTDEPLISCFYSFVLPKMSCNFTEASFCRHSSPCKGKILSSRIVESKGIYA